MASSLHWLLVLGLMLLVLPRQAAAFGAGNIPSIAQVEGHNWRHGDIEDILQTLAFLHGKKWTSMLIKRTYFGNWLRDYSQAIDVGSLKGASAETIRILVWVLSFMAFGYATEEFEVTAERLGVYRPEEHIDNPLGYADGTDARKYDPRLRGPVRPVETEIDPHTGMKNYIANERGDWATSAGFLRYSFERSIHYGRQFTSGSRGRGHDEDLCEALRCLGQALHCLEDFSAHSNYCELVLIEMGYRDVYAHCGSSTKINLGGKRVYPLVTGTFGAVDFLHSVLGEATDHFTQSEVEEVDLVLRAAEQGKLDGGPGGGSSSGGRRGLDDKTDRGLGLSETRDFISLLTKLPGVGDGLASEARSLQEASRAQEERNSRSGGNVNVVPGMSPNFDPVKLSKQIYPVLHFRDRIVRTISSMVSKIPGLEKLLDYISERLSAFVLGLLAPFVRPIIQAVSKSLKDGSSSVIDASAHSQYEPWKNPHCSDPTHSMLSKDHFTNVLNSCAGRVSVAVVEYAVPRILYAWENPKVSVHEVADDILRAFHHPTNRDDRIEVQKKMYNAVRQWADEFSKRHNINKLLSSESVKAGKNHILHHQQKHGAKSSSGHSHSHNPLDMLGEVGHGKVMGGIWNQIRTRDLESLSGSDGDPKAHYLSSESASVPPPQFNFGVNPDYASPTSASSHSPSVPQYPSSSHAPTSGYQPPPGPPLSHVYQHPPGPSQMYQQFPVPPPQTYQPPSGPPPPPGYGGPSQSQYPPQYPSYQAPPSQPAYGYHTPHGGSPPVPYNAPPLSGSAPFHIQAPPAGGSSAAAPYPSYPGENPPYGDLGMDERKLFPDQPNY